MFDLKNINLRKVETLTLILIAVALPLSIAAVNIALGIGLLLVCYRLLTDRSAIRQIFRGITIPLLIYLAVDLFATLFSGFPVHLKSFIEDKWVLTAYFVMLLLPRGENDRKLAVSALIISGSLMAAYAVFQTFSGWDFLRKQELEPFGGGYIAVGVFSHHLTYGGIALIVLITALVRTALHPGFRKSVIWYILTLLCGIGLFVSYSRSAIVGLFCGMGILIFTVNRKLRLKLVVGGLICLALILVLVPGLTDRFMNTFSTGEHNEGPRIRLWLTSLEIIKHHPVLGVGQGNFKLGFEKYHLPGFYHNSAHPHNDFLSVAVDGGVLALACFLAIWIFFFYKMSRLVKPGLGVDPEAWLPVAAMTAVVAILAAGMFQNYQSDAEVANILWFTIGLAFSKRNDNDKQKSD